MESWFGKALLYSPFVGFLQNIISEGLRCLYLPRLLLSGFLTRNLNICYRRVLCGTAAQDVHIRCCAIPSLSSHCRQRAAPSCTIIMSALLLAEQIPCTRLALLPASITAATRNGYIDNFDALSITLVHNDDYLIDTFMIQTL